MTNVFIALPAATSGSPTPVTTTAVTSTPKPTPSPGGGGSGGSTNTGPYLVIAAIVALAGVLLTAYVQWKLGERNIRLNTQSATQVKEDALAKRYQDAAGQLGHEKATVRLAGVYAMAKLADDWSEQRQTCVDVLCAYLRMPWPKFADGTEDPAELEVRRSIGHALSLHLQPGTTGVSWKELQLDFSGARLVDLRLSNVYLANPTSFRGSRFEGTVDLYSFDCPKGVDFTDVRVVGRLNLSMKVASKVDFEGSHIEPGAWLDIDTLGIEPGGSRSVPCSRLRPFGAKVRVQRGRAGDDRDELRGSGVVRRSRLHLAAL